jgi:hypothetical protein
VQPIKHVLRWCPTCVCAKCSGSSSTGAASWRVQHNDQGTPSAVTTETLQRHFWCRFRVTTAASASVSFQEAAL